MTSNEKPSTSRAAGLVTVQLGPDLKRDWTQWCVERGLVPGKALRSLVENALVDGLELAARPSGEGVKVVVAKGPDKGRKVTRKIQFTPSECAAIVAVGKVQGFDFQRWVIAAVRAALAKAPSYGQAELEALTRSNDLMAQVALELAALNRRGAPASELVNLERDVRKHVEVVSEAMAQGAQRWLLKL